jgi:hypothetical protein
MLAIYGLNETADQADRWWVCEYEADRRACGLVTAPGGLVSPQLALQQQLKCFESVEIEKIILLFAP